MMVILKSGAFPNQLMVENKQESFECSRSQMDMRRVGIGCLGHEMDELSSIPIGELKSIYDMIGD